MIPENILSGTNQTNIISNGIFFAYRQIRFVVSTNNFFTVDIGLYEGLPMFADIFYYVSGEPIYYKTISSYSCTLVNVSSGIYNFEYLFDLQDVYQELLKTWLFIAALGEVFIQTNIAGQIATPPYQYNFTSLLKTIVGFRGSFYDSNGLLVIGEGSHSPAYPIQGTATTLPTSPGYNIQSDIFYVLNGSIAPSYSSFFNTDNIFKNLPVNQLLQTLTNQSFILGGITQSLPNTFWNLSNLTICDDDYSNFEYKNAKVQYVDCFDYFPVIDHSGYDSFYIYLILYPNNDPSLSYAAPLISSPITLNIYETYILPCGLAQIKIMDAISLGVNYEYLTNPTNNCSYRIALINVSLDAYEWVSPMFHVGFNAPLLTPINNSSEVTTLMFQNMYGHFEAITFQRYQRGINITSEDQFITYDQDILGIANPLSVGHNRMNIRANDEITLTGTFDESLMDWVKEMLMSPMILQQINIGGTVSLQPCSIYDIKYPVIKTKTEGRWLYTVTFKMKPNIDYKQIRN